MYVVFQVSENCESLLNGQGRVLVQLDEISQNLAVRLHPQVHGFHVRLEFFHAPVETRALVGVKVATASRDQVMSSIAFE